MKALEKESEKVLHWAKVFMMSSGVVREEKLRLARTTPCTDCRTLVNVMVFPLPGGPHRIRGDLLSSQAPRISEWRTVSVVVTTTSVAVTL